MAVFVGKDVLFDYFLTSEDLFGMYLDVVKKMKLAQDEKEVISWVEFFKREHARVPTTDELRLKKEVVLGGNIDEKVLFKETIDFLKNERVKEWVIEVADRLAYGGIDVDALYSDVLKVVYLFENRDMRVRSFRDRALEVIEKIKVEEGGERIPTGIKALDKVLFGGFGIGEFACIIAPPGRGKTTMLVNMAYGALLARKKVLFLSLELSEEQIVGRFIRRIAKQSRKDIRVNSDRAKDAINMFETMAGRLAVLYHRPHSLSVNNLMVVVDRVRRSLGGLDAVYIDYFDRLKNPDRDYRVGMGLIVDYLRDLGNTQKLSIVSATQANRASLSAVLVTEEHTSESFKKIESSDVVMSVNRSEQELKKNAGRLVMLKNREFGGAGAQVAISIDFDKGYMGDFGSV